MISMTSLYKSDIGLILKQMTSLIIITEKEMSYHKKSMGSN